MLHVALEYNKSKYGAGKNNKENKVVDGHIDDIKW